MIQYIQTSLGSISVQANGSKSEGLAALEGIADAAMSLYTTSSSLTEKEMDLLKDCATWPS